MEIVLLDIKTKSCAAARRRRRLSMGILYICVCVCLRERHLSSALHLFPTHTAFASNCVHERARARARGPGPGRGMQSGLAFEKSISASRFFLLLCQRILYFIQIYSAAVNQPHCIGVRACAPQARDYDDNTQVVHTVLRHILHSLDVQHGSSAMNIEDSVWWATRCASTMLAPHLPKAYFPI